MVEATAANPFVKGMTGPDRAMLYALAAGTGFRREELRTLTPEQFNLDSDPPTVRVLACYAKIGIYAKASFTISRERSNPCPT
ncbi:MAG: hypothetical protein ABSE84_12965 [Isosphaeraceae bacterium]